MNVGSWKNDEKGDMLLRIWKIIKMILEARKSSEYKKKERNKIVIQGKKSVLKNPGHL